MDITKNIGQYDVEYSKCKCFWGESPGKFVLLIKRYLHDGTILDLGAGEGKNSIYLSQNGFKIIAIECSKFAINNFKRLLKNKPIQDISIICSDVRTFETTKKFDCVIAYGLLHCLSNKTDISNLVNKMKKWTKVEGINVIVSFTAEIPIPNVQSYLNPCFIKKHELEKWYKDWEILKMEEEIINELHPTTKIEHQHSVIRLIARKLKK
ncbi:MAG: methyltransferase domain-containing protein [Nitrososphaeraceae archaeon]